MGNSLDRHLSAYEKNSEDEFDFDNRVILNWYPHRILSHTKGRSSLLELGLGHGFSTSLLAGNFSRHVVVEGSPSVIKLFRSRHPEFSGIVVDSLFEHYETLEKFDVIVMGFVLEHVDNPTQVINHFRKFLAPGGRIFIAVPNAESMNRRLGLLAGMLDNLDDLSDYDHELGHQRYYTVDSLLATIEQCGLHTELLEGVFLKPLSSANLESLDLPAEILQALCTLGIDHPQLSLGLLVAVSDPDRAQTLVDKRGDRKMLPEK